MTDCAALPRVLVVDDLHRTLSRALASQLAGHAVEVAHDVVEAIHHIDCAVGHPFDVIFCDLTRGDVTGPELWAYLSRNRKSVAKRIVFVATGPIPTPTRAFLAVVPNAWVQLPLDPRGGELAAPGVHPERVA